MLFSFSGQKKIAVSGLSRFFGKIRAERSEVWRFSQKRRSRLTLTSRKRHSDTFAQRKGELPQEWLEIFFNFNKKNMFS